MSRTKDERRDPHYGHHREQREQHGEGTACTEPGDMWSADKWC
ncbi:hypothetical protein [Corynebacterium kroppenstedtii]|nr:hypothetical protein [Corynebacterium kroppenstedtii]